MVKLYNESKLVDILKEHSDNNDMDLCNEEFNIWNMESPTSDDESSSDNDNRIYIDDNDEYQDIYLEMLNKEYNNIDNNSILKQCISITRDDNVSYNDTE